MVKIIFMLSNESSPVGLHLVMCPLSFTDSSTNNYLITIDDIKHAQSYKAYLRYLPSALQNVDVDVYLQIDNAYRLGVYSVLKA